MKKKCFILLVLVFCIICIVGCNKSTDSWYGEKKENKYINKYFSFSIDIPNGWDLDQEKIKENNELISKNPKDLDEAGVCSIKPIEEKAIKVDKSLNITEGLSIRCIKTNQSLKDYSNEYYESIRYEFGSINEQKIYSKNINNKEFMIIEMKNDICYLTKSDNIILAFEAIYANESKDKIFNSLNSIQFN